MGLSFAELPPMARAVWAKSGDPSGHGLLAHMLDVAAVTEVLLEHEPHSTVAHYAKQFGLPSPYFCRYAATLVGLHDFGKAIPGFQTKWLQGRRQCEHAGLGFSPSSLSVSDHAQASGALLRDHLVKASLDLSWTLGVLQAISAHHGYNFSLQEITSAAPPFEAPTWSQARQAIFSSYWQTLEPEGLPETEEIPLPAVEWLAGLTSVADWIASNTDWFPLGERADSLAEHFVTAKRLATQALKEIGWSPFHPLSEGTASTEELLGRFLKEVTPRPLQLAGDRLLAEANGPALLLVEAPMGEGKTELAFLAHLRLQAINQHRGLYIALPTQATGNAMFDRALSFLKSFNSQQRLDIQLVHGGAMMDQRIQHLREIHGEPQADITSAAWFSQRRRALLSPYGVGTIDQALFATLNVKHHFVRLWGLGNRVVVLDEVHAYDTYTSGLIESLLRWLKGLGSSVVLMSATLPEQRRKALLQAWDILPEEVPDLPYPRVIMADSQGVSGEHFASRPLSPVRLQAIDEDLDELADCARRKLESGGYGAVIVNTVDRAQKLYCQLQACLDRSVQILLFHARFPADERGARERQVLQIFGDKSERRPGRALLIATQVAEQSLDIDFDFLISDLAPVDLLLQRAGRLHRHGRERPAGHTEACLTVAGLNPQRLPALKRTAWAFVYEPYILGRTWALLSREYMLQLPLDIDRLVQAVYSDAALPDDINAEAKSYIENEALDNYAARFATERLQAMNIAIDPDDEPQAAYLQKPRGNEDGGGLGLTNRTRLGDDAITLVPVYQVPGGWAVLQGTEPFDPHSSLADELAKQLYARQLKLSRQQVVNHFSTFEAPPAFAEHPLLRYMKPLVLENGSHHLGKLHLRLDQELGLVYESPDVDSHSEEKQ